MNCSHGAVGFGSRGSAGSVNSSYDGLNISDAFGDELRDLQQQSAQEQMAFQTASAERAMEFSAQEAQKNRDWQERMSNTAYRRAVEDMKAAGLNPILAAGGSSMASSTPSGASAAGIAQSGSQAQVSEYNSGLAALEVYLDAIVSVLGSAGSLVGRLGFASIYKGGK